VYRAIVAAKVRAAWRQLQQRNPDAVLDQLAEPFEHRFAGQHAMGGVRRTRAAQAAWFARLFRLFPDVRFTVRDVLVAGWPWRTRAVAIVDVRLPSEPGYANVVMQHLELRWGRIARVDNLEDTQALAALLDRRARAGDEEAAAAAIDDDAFQATGGGSPSALASSAGSHSQTSHA